MKFFIFIIYRTNLIVALRSGNHDIINLLLNHPGLNVNQVMVKNQLFFIIF